MWIKRDATTAASRVRHGMSQSRPAYHLLVNLAQPYHHPLKSLFSNGPGSVRNVDSVTFSPQSEKDEHGNEGWG
jgi:hypothetical protein